MSGMDNVSYTITKVTAATYTATTNDSIILCDPTSNAITVTIPAAGADWQSGRTLFFRSTGVTNAVTIQPASGTIDGAANITLAAAAVHGAMVVSDGSNYFSIVKS